jgi:hypothetical protein
MQLTALQRRPLGLRPAIGPRFPRTVRRGSGGTRVRCMIVYHPCAVVSDLLSRLESLEVTAENGKIFDQPCWIWLCFAKSALKVICLVNTTSSQLDIQKYSNCTLPCGERAALVALQPSQLLKVRSSDHASGLASKQLLAWFLGIWGTRREQHLLKYAGPCGANGSVQNLSQCAGRPAMSSSSLVALRRTNATGAGSINRKPSTS